MLKKARIPFDFNTITKTIVINAIIPKAIFIKVAIMASNSVLYTPMKVI